MKVWRMYMGHGDNPRFVIGDDRGAARLQYVKVILEKNTPKPDDFIGIRCRLYGTIEQAESGVYDVEDPIFENMKQLNSEVDALTI